jgi:hypothetical protein
MFGVAVWQSYDKISRELELLLGKLPVKIGMAAVNVKNRPEANTAELKLVPIHHTTIII